VAPNTRIEPPGLDFLSALALKEATVTVTLGGVERTIQRARLGLHYRLAELDALSYVSLASGVPEDDISLEEWAPAFGAIARLNSRAGLSVLELVSSPEKAKPAFDYRGRGLATIVHDLAHAYGWTAAYILEELSPEEAWCYLQEIHLERHEERVWAYNLSDLGRDKHGKQKPLRDPPWMSTRIGPTDQRDRPPLTKTRAAAYEPTGTVINIDELAAHRRRP